MAQWWPRGCRVGLPRRVQAARSSALLLIACAIASPFVPATGMRAAAQETRAAAAATSEAQQTLQGEPRQQGQPPPPELSSLPAFASPRQQEAHRFLAARGIGWSQQLGSAQMPAGSAPADRLSAARAAQAQQLRAAGLISVGAGGGSSASSRLRPETSGTSSGPGTWQTLGPAQVTTATYGAVTGRITSLAGDPNDGSGNTVYFGSTGGGVWKSTNAAGTTSNVRFTPLTDALPVFTNTLGSLSIGALTIQPGSSGVILAGTGDSNDALDSYYGVGILRSIDGGNTWTLIGGSKDARDHGGLQNYSFTGSGFAGFAWSSANSNLVVAAVSQSYEGQLVNAGSQQNMESGLYYSTDAGQTWYLSVIEDSSSATVQSPQIYGSPPGNPATAVVWNPIRQSFYAAVQFHGYYASPDGVTWTRLANQPGAGLTLANCPTNPGGQGQGSCPIVRGALAVQPVTGDMFAITVDVSNQDQGIFQDVCSTSGGAVSSCASGTVAFGRQLPSTALEAGPGDPTIAQGGYDLTMTAVPSGGDTILFAGTTDIFRCSLAAGCTWRNTTNSATCAAAQVAPAQHATEATFGSSGLLYFGNDGGLWRSKDTVAQSGAVCDSSDASHYQNLNTGLGSLAEISHFSISAAAPTALLAGIGGFGTVSTLNAQGPWQQLLTGEGSYTAIDPANGQTLYTQSGVGVNIHRCTAGPSCNAAGFGATPAIGSPQVSGDADYFTEAAPWLLDPLNSANLILGTCRVWRGPATGGSGWSASNVLSPVLDTDRQAVCNGDATLRSLGVGLASGSSSGSERMYAGMAGFTDGGGTVPGHVYAATVPQAGGTVSWTDLYTSTVSNGGTNTQFNSAGFAVSSVAVDPHDPTGQTVYLTLQGLTGNGYSSGEVYGSTDGGAHWLNLTNSLPQAPANSVVVDPNVSSIVYVALDTGVYYTQNITSCSNPMQNCWAVYGSGLPNAPVTQLQVFNNGSSSLLEASTYGRGIWSLGLVTASADATLSPTSYTFAGQQTQTTSAPQPFTLTNTGPAAFVITQIQTTGDYAQTNNCGSQLAQNASCTIQVTFTPTANGDRPGTLKMYANVSGGYLTSTLDGAGLAPGSITLNPTSLSFPSTATSATSASETVTLQNPGGIAVQLQAPTVTADYQLTGNTCGSSLAGGASCTMQVAFAPTGTGDRPGRLTIPSNLSSSPATVSLDGTGLTPPSLSLSPASLTFPSTAQGAVSASLGITVTNTGGATAQLQTPTVTGDYQITGNTCLSTLAPGANCSLQIAFAPTGTGSRAGLLTIQANVAGGQVTAALNGTGLTPAMLTFTPSSLTFPNTTQGTTSATQTITLNNSGGVSAQLQPPTITGEYAVTSNNCGSSITAGGSCTLQLTFTPAAAGDRPGRLTIPANVSGGQVTASLDGTGLAPPALTFNPSTLTFPVTATGASSAAQAITVTSSGGTPVQVGTADTTGDFSISSNSCPATLAPGASCTVQVIFSPTATGTRSGQLAIAANVSGGQATAALSGPGVAPAALTLSPTSLSFPTTAEGSTSPTQTITVTSSGGVSAQLQAPSVTGDFQITGNNCPASLAPAATCTVLLAFAPAATGSRTGVFTLPADISGGAVTASLNGTGATPAALSVSPTSLSFAATTIGTTTASQTVQLTSTGGVPVQLQTPTVTSDYGIPSNSCPASLAPSMTCTIQVAFAPIAAGDRPGTLTVPANVAGGQATAALDGTGLTPAALTLTPASLSFPDTAQGTTSAVQSIAVKNTGGSTAQLSGTTVSGDFALASQTCGSTLAAGATCSVSITFHPTTTGSRSGVLAISANISGGQATASLSGNGLPPPAVSFSPSPVAFGSVVQGSASAVQAITITSTGGAAVTLGTPSVSGDYQISGNTCPASLAVAATCTIQVVFHPSATGDRPGTLTLPGSMTGGQATDALDGTGLAPGVLTLSPTSLNFAGIAVGTTSTPSPVTVSNTGSSPVTLGTATVTGDYQIASNACGSTLAPSASCQISIAFHPGAAGDRPGQLQVPGNISGGQVVASLDGQGLAPGNLTLSPGSADFASVAQGTTSPPTPFSLTNTGGVLVHISGLGTSGDFALASNACSSGTIAAGATCAVSVTFTPTALGARTGTLTVASDATDSPTSAPLTGTGVTPANVTLTPGSLSFSPTATGAASASQTVTVKNTGGVSAAFTGATVTADYQITANGCGSTLAAGASCTIQVAFAPTATGDRPGSLSQPGPYAGSPSTAPLDGTGLTPGQLVLTPSSLTYAALVIGGASSAQSVTVSNSGGAPVTLQPISTTGDYGITGNSCGATLAAGTTCAVQVVFHPTAAGDRSGQLLVPGNVAGGGVAATLDGTGVSPAALSFSPTSISFGGVVQGATSPPAAIVLTNSGGEIAHLQTPGASGDYAIVANACAATLAPASTCTIQVVFTPQALGSRNGTLSLASDAPGSPAVASLTGIGLAPANVSLTPNPLIFSATVEGASPASRALTVTNTGGVAVSLNAPGLTGDYALASSNCPASLGPGATCTLQIAFAPTASGDRSGTLSLGGQFADSPAVASLDGTGVAPGALALAPASLNFGSVTNGTNSTAQTITLSNPGGQAVTLGAPHISGDYSLLSSTCAATLNPGSNCTLQITFHPTASGDRPGLLAVPGNIPGGEITGALDGSGIAPGALGISPTSEIFPPTLIHTSSASKTLTVNNTGGLGLPLQTPVLTGDYQLVASTCGSTLGAGAACSLQILFQPSAAGDRPGSLSIGTGGQQASAALDGTGTAPAALALSPTSLSFGSLVLGKTSSPQTATLSNTGSLPAQLQMPVLTGDYQLTSNSCGGTLSAGATCTLQVSFAPTGTGNRPGSLTVSTADSTSTAALALNGTGTAPPSLVLTPTSVAFAATAQGATAAVQNVTVANVGTSTVHLLPFTISGDFALSGDSCTGVPLNPNYSCTLSITFTPAAGGSRTGLLTVADATESHTLTLAGIGLSVPTDTLSTNALLFGSQVVGTVSTPQSVTVTNSGGATLSNIATSVTGPFIATNNCGYMLGGGLSCSVAVTYAPTAAGAQAGVLTIADALRSQTVAFSGSGTLPPEAIASPSSLNFGNYAVAATSPAQQVTFSNNGTSPIAGLTAAIVNASFVLSTNTCGALIAPGGSCTLGVSFMPQQPGNQSGQLTLTSPSLPGALAVALTGAGEDFQLAISGSLSAIITNGQTATYHLVVTPVGSSAGALAITCSGVPANATCTANPPTVNVAGTATGSVTVTIATGLTATGTAAIAPGTRPGAAPNAGLADMAERLGLGTAAMALLLPFFTLRGRARRSFLMVVAAALLVLAPTACGVHASGGSSATTTTTGGAGGGTASGTYPITLTASFPGAQRTVTVSLTVQ